MQRIWIKNHKEKGRGKIITVKPLFSLLVNIMLNIEILSNYIFDMSRKCKGRRDFGQPFLIKRSKQIQGK